MEIKKLDNHRLLTMFARKAIDHNLSGKHEDYQESLDYFFEIKNRLEANEKSTINYDNVKERQRTHE